MDNFTTTYAEFYHELNEFLELLCQKYKTGIPASLYDVKAIPGLLPVDDPDLTISRKNQLAKKYCILSQVVTLLLNKVGQFVDERHLDWLQGRSKKLQWRMRGLEMCLAALGMSGYSPEDVQILPSGIGGVNPGVRRGLNYETMIKLQDVINELQ